MSMNIRFPNITAKTEADQLVQIKSYLHQLVEQLNWALSTIESGNTTGARSSGGIGPGNTTDFNELKSLIIKSSTHMDNILPIPRGQLGEGWNPDSIPNGVHVFRTEYPLKNASGTLLMNNGTLIQMPATADRSVLVQIALSVDNGSNPLYRLKWYSNWSDWVSFKI